MNERKLASEFEKLQPWVTQFVINGKSYGGKYDPSTDPRMTWFYEVFPDVETILDLGSLEGAQSFRLAERPTVKAICGLEVRPDNIRRATFIKELLRIDKVRFERANLETDDLTRFGTFDAIFCCGVLYHLPEPWRLIEKLRKLSKNLFIWTHYAPDDQASLVKNGYHGMIYREFGWTDPQSGVSPESFWLSFDSLMTMMKDYGYRIVRLIENSPYPQPGPVTTFTAQLTGD